MQHFWCVLSHLTFLDKKLDHELAQSNITPLVDVLIHRIDSSVNQLQIMLDNIPDPSVGQQHLMIIDQLLL